MSVILNGVDRLRAHDVAHRCERRAPPVHAAVHKGLPTEAEHQQQAAQAPEENKQHVEHDIGNLTEHTETHIRDLTALGHIFGIKTHGNNPSKNH